MGTAATALRYPNRITNAVHLSQLACITVPVYFGQDVAPHGGHEKRIPAPITGFFDGFQGFARSALFQKSLREFWALRPQVD